MNASTKKGLIAVGVLAGSILYPEMASAAVPAAVDSAFTTLTADLQSILTKAWDLVVPITAGFLYLKFFKKTAKAAG